VFKGGEEVAHVSVRRHRTRYAPVRNASTISDRVKTRDLEESVFKDTGAGSVLEEV
jgi:hypothetical protein